MKPTSASADTLDLALPRGVAAREMALPTGEPWWRVVVEATGRLLGSGFEKAEAVRLARRELERRGDR